MDKLRDCALCPRECHVNRMAGEIGYCGQTGEVCVGRASLHMWEEPCISGEKGSGTVFFSGCSLGCVYCQNREISNGGRGKKITVERLSDIFIELQKKGANNINLVTPDHFVPQVIEALKAAKMKGLNIPIVYNSGGYTKIDTLKDLEGYIDIYLPDLKYMDRMVSKKYSNAEDYFEFASKSIGEMIRQVGEPVLSSDGIMQKGVIVRHLALPGCIEDSKNIIKYLYDTFGDKIYISIMNQYTPIKHFSDYPDLNQKITPKDYNKLIDFAINIGVKRGYIQEGDTALESFIPEFNGEGV